MPTSSAVALPTLTAAEIAAILQSAGAIDEPGGSFARMKLDGSTLIAGDNVYPYNPNTKAPAVRVRIVEPPEQYQGFWFDQAHAEYANRPEAADTMCKSYYDKPDQARKFSESGASCEACPFHPFTNREKLPIEGGKCAWKGDIRVQIMPADGSPLTGEETVWTLTLPQTSMIEYRGTRAKPEEGSVTDKNFMFRLAEFAQAHAQEWGVTPAEAINLALVSYASGGVVADIRLPRAKAEDGSRSWTVISFDPVYVETSFEDEPAPAAAQIEAGGDTGEPPLPF